MQLLICCQPLYGNKQLYPCTTASGACDITWHQHNKSQLCSKQKMSNIQNSLPTCTLHWAIMTWTPGVWLRLCSEAKRSNLWLNIWHFWAIMIIFRCAAIHWCLPEIRTLNHVLLLYLCLVGSGFTFLLTASHPHSACNPSRRSETSALPSGSVCHWFEVQMCSSYSVIYCQTTASWCVVFLARDQKEINILTSSVGN